MDLGKSSIVYTPGTEELSALLVTKGQALKSANFLTPT